MKTSVLACVAFAIMMAVAAARPHPLGYTFDMWLEEYGPKSYTVGSDEYFMRRNLFNLRMADVDQHNANPAKTYSRTMRNRFADMTEDELTKFTRGGGVYDGPSEYREDFNMPLRSVDELPAEVDWRKHWPPVVTAVKDQGQCGSCYAHAATECIESYTALASGQLPVLSQQQASMCTYNPNDCGGNGGCGGGTAEVVFASVASNGGMASDWTYPYLAYWGTNDACAFNKTMTPPVSTVSSYVKLPHNNYTAMMNAIALVGPLAISVDAAAWPDYDGGVYTGCGSDTVVLDHNVQLVGYGTDDKTGLAYWLVRNSWGTSFGENGYIRVYRYGDNAPCAMDNNPAAGDGCNNGPSSVKVCGSCGILYDSTYPKANAAQP